MKRLVTSVAIVLAALSTAGAQQSCHQGGKQNMAGVIGSTIGALVGSTIGDGRGQPLAIGAGGLLGGLIGESLSQRRPAANPSHSMVKRLGDQRTHTLDAARQRNNTHAPESQGSPPPTRAGPLSGA